MHIKHNKYIRKNRQSIFSFLKLYNKKLSLSCVQVKVFIQTTFLSNLLTNLAQIFTFDILIFFE